MAQDRVRQNIRNRESPNSTTYYEILGLHPSASPIAIRRAYRQLSKRYHPDTTDLPTETATIKFQKLNQAYATLSNPERRAIYDQKIGYSRLNVIQPPPSLNNPVNQKPPSSSSSAYLDPTDRPLSAGEIFVLFILGLTFLGCLLLAIAIGLTQGESALLISKPSGNDLLTLPEINFIQQAKPDNLDSQIPVNNQSAQNPQITHLSE
ncbi:MAG: DnaJ domain-containing protein [Moorea sp. SIO3I7]|uniref:J domain-containing protein n=1 Tax=Moorena sp. SIO3I8 TaxID=2607833 RepID=UPI0013BF67E3|nr:DnaJ domain-containing protein [Moorena sp. SIO3I8]NEN94371.1 DnaJ domain-containing protein [Moorena sp. SIO3I7]NEO04560.1 DnaJ domain-containing protein [Moorena sp. SIO3I8]